MKKNNVIIFFLTILLLTSCGFKRLNINNDNTFEIKEIKITGEKRVGFQIKNQILSSSKSNSAKSFNLEINLAKEKVIKEKDLTNKITKYNLEFKVNIDIIDNNSSDITKYTRTERVPYSVAKTHTATVQNEKSALDNIAEIIAENVINYINLNL